MGFTKLFSEIVASSIWNEDDKTRIVWITLLALKDEDHIARASVDGLAHQARVSISDCQRALEVLSASDEHDRSGVDDGRRIRKVDGGWFVINGELFKHRGEAEWKLEQFRAKAAERARRYRGRQRHVTVTHNHAPSQTVTEITGSLPLHSSSSLPQIRSEQKSSCFVLENEASRASEIGSASPKTPEKKPRSGPLMNADAMERFERNPAYEGIDVNQEAWKFKSWCQANKKPETVKRFTNWLNRIV
jgi:hypothetical protein